MMPTIRVEDEVFQGLKKIAEPFTDTPNTVIRRLLEEKGVLSKSKSSVDDAGNSDIDPSVQISAASLTPQSVFENYLLYILRNCCSVWD